MLYPLKEWLSRLRNLEACRSDPLRTGQFPTSLRLTGLSHFESIRQHWQAPKSLSPAQVDGDISFGNLMA
jgi:hypothetical protein